MATLGKTVFVLGLMSFGLMLFGCSEQQIAEIDRTISDVNTVTSAVSTTASDTPIGGMLPADIKLYLALAATAVSGAANVWQKIKGDLMKKTTKAIVKGIEAGATDRAANPTDPIKAEIEKKMKESGVYDKANLLVDKLKLGII